MRIGEYTAADIADHLAMAPHQFGEWSIGAFRGELREQLAVGLFFKAHLLVTFQWECGVYKHSERKSLDYSNAHCAFRSTFHELSLWQSDPQWGKVYVVIIRYTDPTAARDEGTSRRCRLHR